MRYIEDVDPETVDFEGYDDVYRYKISRAEQGVEEDYNVKYIRMTESYEDMGF